MNWYNYLACFFAGMFLANMVPHFVHGISGDRFPTPLARPPGRGLSSATVNVVWGLGNLAAGYVLCRVGKVYSGNERGVGLLFPGIVLISVVMSAHFYQEAGWWSGCGGPRCRREPVAELPREE